MVYAVTSYDVAREAGVSQTAVSFFISGKASQYRISLSTQARIKSAIDRMAFTPNPQARQLRQGIPFPLSVIPHPSPSLGSDSQPSVTPEPALLIAYPYFP